MLALSTAQQHMTIAHANLSLVQEQVGLGHVAILPAEDKPEKKGQPVTNEAANETVGEEVVIAAE